MTKWFIIQAEARLDIEEAALWYEVEQPGLGVVFLDDLDHLLERINSAPQQFPEIDKGIRRGLMHRFPYSVYFTDDPTGVVLLAVLHLKRCPDIWKSRRKPEV